MQITSKVHYSIRRETTGGHIFLEYKTTDATAEIREITYADAPIAFLRQAPFSEMTHLQNPKTGNFPRGFSIGFHQKYGSFLRIEYRIYFDVLYVRDYARNYVKNGTGIVTRKNLAYLFSNFTQAKNSTKENAVHTLTSAAARYLLIDGDVWISTTEPAYKVDSECDNDDINSLHTAIISESYNPAGAALYYNASQWEEVLSVARHRSKIRHEEEAVTEKLGAMRQIEVMIPGVVKLPRKHVELFNKGSETDRITTAFPFLGDPEDPDFRMEKRRRGA